MPTRRALTRRGTSSPSPAALGFSCFFVQRPSLSRIPCPIKVIAAPPRSIRCVGPQRVTSWPKMRCQTSSRGKPASENPPQRKIRTPPTGAYHSRLRRIGAGPGRVPFGGRKIASQPEAKMPIRPSRIG